MPVVGEVLDRWDSLLKDYDEVVYIPMSSRLSSSCATAKTLADDYDGRVQVVDNQRISVTQRQSVLDAVRLAELGYDAAGIKEYLEKTKFDSSIYIYVPTLKYLKKGGRVTPAAAALGTLLRIKPVLQIHVLFDDFNIFLTALRQPDGVRAPVEDRGADAVLDAFPYLI